MSCAKYVQAVVTKNQIKLLRKLSWRGDSESKLNREEVRDIIDRLLKEKSEKSSKEPL